MGCGGWPVWGGGLCGGVGGEKGRCRVGMVMEGIWRVGHGRRAGLLLAGEDLF